MLKTIYKIRWDYLFEDSLEKQDSGGFFKLLQIIYSTSKGSKLPRYVTLFTTMVG